ncbi:MAG: CHAP domain-containing protein [Ruminococcus sp.]|nr:CHAP domain-containing protein [Ruminococcus sp.]
MKRGLEVVLLILLMIIPVTAVYATESSQPSAQAVFTPRLTAPEADNDYYYSDKNIFYKYGFGMPNCTAYAWGRAYEILGEKPQLSVDSAHRWWNYNLNGGYYPYGQTPKLGAIACWEYNGGGHVAVVEVITSTTMTLSHSAYSGTNFYTTEYDLDAPNGGSQNPNWTFKGYIYILDNAQPGEPIRPSGDRYRVDSSNGVNLRKGHGTSYSIVGALPYNTEFIVTEVYDDGQYLWGKTSYCGVSGWCVLDFATLIYDDPDVDTTKPTESPTNPTEPADPNHREEDWADLNGDGKTSITDATLIQKYLVGIVTELPDKETADANGDGKVTVTDATYIQKVLASLI